MTVINRTASSIESRVSIRHKKPQHLVLISVGAFWLYLQAFAARLPHKVVPLLFTRLRLHYASRIEAPSRFGLEYGDSLLSLWSPTARVSIFHWLFHEKFIDT